MSPYERSAVAPLRSTWLCFFVAVLLSIAGGSPAVAITFSQIGDGSAQFVVWSYSPSCLTYTQGTVWAVNGRIPLTNEPPSQNAAGGMLDWTGQGMLRVVGLTKVWSTMTSAPICREAWAAVNAQDTPLVFTVERDMGDPDPLEMDLLINPRLVGTVVQKGGMAGNPGSSTLHLQMEVSVAVDGQLVSSDTLVIQHTVSNDQTVNWTPAFPKGMANQVVVPGVTAGSEITVMLFAYMRDNFTDYSSIVSSGPYGEGPAIVIEAQPVNVLAVESEGQGESLWLGIRPNPSLSPRIHYTLSASSKVSLAIYDVTGARVATLADGIETAGRREVSWNGRATNGEPVAAGVYLVELIADSQRRVGKVVLLGR